MVNISSSIHPTAIIDENVKLGSNVIVGPYSIINANVIIGNHTTIGNHVTICENTIIGDSCKIFHSSVIGEIPQDLKFDGEITQTLVGDRTVIREYVTINSGTKALGKTQVGSGVLLMAYVHIAHDCIIGSNVILANNATLAGHVEIDKNTIIGGNSAIHQFVKIGKNAMVGGMSGLEKNLIPYGLYIGIRSNMKGLNLIGLKRKGLDNQKIKTINEFIEKAFDKNDSIENNLNKVNNEVKSIEEVKEIIDFIEKSNKRGLVTL